MSSSRRCPIPTGKRSHSALSDQEIYLFISGEAEILQIIVISERFLSAAAALRPSAEPTPPSSPLPQDEMRAGEAASHRFLIATHFLLHSLPTPFHWPPPPSSLHWPLLLQASFHLRPDQLSSTLVARSRNRTIFYLFIHLFSAHSKHRWTLFEAPFFRTALPHPGPGWLEWSGTAASSLSFPHSGGKTWKTVSLCDTPKSTAAEPVNFHATVANFFAQSIPHKYAPTFSLTRRTQSTPLSTVVRCNMLDRTLTYFHLQSGYTTVLLSKRPFFCDIWRLS